MNDITIDENYDELKEDFFKGLTFRQTVYGLLTILVGTCAGLMFGVGFKLPQMAAVYLALLFAVPVAANGFVTVYGMTIFKFYRRYRETKERGAYLYQSEESPEADQVFLETVVKETAKPQKEPKKERHPSFCYLDLDGQLMEGGEAV